MKIITGYPWCSNASIIAVPANSTLTLGRLVIDCEVAEKASWGVPHLSGMAGDFISMTCGSMGWYGWMPFESHGIALFQDKDNWLAPARLELIAYSVKKLKDYLNIRPCQVALNYPGIEGGLTREEVEPLLVTLPDLVGVYLHPGQD